MHPPPEAAAASAGARDAAAALQALSETLPLPGHPGPPSLFTEAASLLGGTIHLAGVSSKIGEETVCGSAAAVGDLPLDRAYFELLERVSVLRAMARTDATFSVRGASGRRTGEVGHARLFSSPESPSWRAARSNGVAIGSSWESAARHAHWELLERDRVLRSWYGESAPRPICGPDSLAHFPDRASLSYEIQAYELGSDHEGVVAGVFAFPHGQEPLSYGFAARSSRETAVSAAALECVQRLGFLWGEPVPTSDPEPAPCPDYHQEFYLVPANHRALRAWLSGEHVRFRGLLGHPEGGREATSSPAGDAADLTPPELAGRLCVAKAIHADRVPLVFGRGHPWLCEVPPPLAVHPLA